MRFLRRFCAVGLLALMPSVAGAGPTLQSFPLPKGAGPHDVAPASDGAVWYTAQAAGALGRLDPHTGKTEQIPLGQDSAPHGVIIGPDGAPWVTDGGLNAIVRLDPATRKPEIFPLPKERDIANLNTATFDRSGNLWFTGQNGVYGRLDPKTRAMKVFDAPRGIGPYGITTTRDGLVFYASLAGNYLGQVDTATGTVQVLEPPQPKQGARRVWPDSQGDVWISEWNAGRIARYRPSRGAWQSWRLPGDGPEPYAIYVDEKDGVWVSDFGANAIWRFDPPTQRFEKFTLPHPDGGVRQLAGRKGEVWGAESGADHLVVIRFADKAS